MRGFAVAVWLLLGSCGSDGGGGASDPAKDRDHDGVMDVDDCDPENPAIRPGGTEVCDGFDNDCNGQTDEFFDLDGDGFLVDDPGCRAMTADVDCDDAAAAVHPGAAELCDGFDNDCSGLIDDASDADEDGTNACDDCDDHDALVHPGQAEACDARDNDCNGITDDLWDEDADGDSTCMGDCDDGDAQNASVLPEICDLQDNDCDGLVDEDYDGDGDGVLTCAGDCDDTDPLVNSHMPEICDGGLDTNCDGLFADDGDLDGDGFDWCTDNDCDDRDLEVFPGAVEICNVKDDDCDGAIDNLPECAGCTADAGYWFCTTARTWQAASATCQGFGTDLAVIGSDAENTSMTLLGDAYFGVNRYWVGLSDTLVEGTFEWVDGTAAAYTNWAPGAPSGGPAIDCVTLRGGYVTWADQDCANLLGFVCE